MADDSGEGIMFDTVIHCVLIGLGIIALVVIIDVWRELREKDGEP